MTTTVQYAGRTESTFENRLQQAAVQNLIAQPQFLDEHTPWPTVAVAFVGALISAELFLTFLVLFAIQTKLIGSFSFYFFTGIAFIGVSVPAALRRRAEWPLFMEMLLFIAQIIGIVMLGIALFMDSPFESSHTVFLVLAIVYGICSGLLPMAWARAIGGFVTACLLFTFLFQQNDAASFHASYVLPQAWPAYLYVSLLPLIAAAGIGMQHNNTRHGKWSTTLWLEPLLGGWIAASLLIAALSIKLPLFFSSGFMSAPAVHAEHDTFISLFLSYIRMPPMWVEIAMLPLAWIWAASKQPVFKHWRVMVCVLVATVFCCIRPSLAPCLALGILMLASRRYKLAAFAGLCAVLQLGALYYDLRIPLAQKAVWLAMTSAVLLLISLPGKRLIPQKNDPSASIQNALATPSKALGPAVSSALLALCAAIALGGVNFNIWQQEHFRASGKRVMIALAPVDPRSLMQGDYMTLNFDVPLESDMIARRTGNAVVYAYLDVDTNGVARITREARAGEPRIALVRRNGRWQVPANAWFFQEGDAKRFERARYGIFAVAPDGKSALVGLADDSYEPIVALP